MTPLTIEDLSGDMPEQKIVESLDDVARVWSEADLDVFSVASLKDAFARRAVSISPKLTRF